MEMKVKCPRCSGEVELGPDRSELDPAYKLKCPVLHTVLIKRAGDPTAIECPDMRGAITAAIESWRLEK
jgi:hypothetical protein